MSSTKRTAAAALGAVGVVFGDIGTSPLYTLQVAAEQANAVPSRADVFGVVSLILWALILAVSVKYVTFVMRADNRGEGGILALLALLPVPEREGRGPMLFALLGIAGAALLFGDGMITPAISVLSALEGLERAAPGLERYVVPLTGAVLVGLFALQPRGTGKVGKMFGPIMVTWFVAIGALGLKELIKNPVMLGAISPSFAAAYFTRHGFGGLRILGVVVLAITGGEALYADMGYFGVRPIRLSWFALVLPALALSYMGQGALVLRDPSAARNPFFAMVPSGAPAYALVVLAALATAIASQALISGVFSLTHQAIGLGYFPRLTLVHTSHEAEGHIYVPLMNWGLMTACIALVVHFKHSARLASAYGIAVSGTMAITSIVFFEVTRKTWKWSASRSVPLLLLFLSFDLPFFGANSLKFFDGGYIPIFVGALFFIVMVDWHKGRRALRRRLEKDSGTLAEFFDALPSRNVIRIPGTAIYPTSTNGVPRPLSLHATHLRSIMEHVVIVNVIGTHEPRVDEAHRHEYESFPDGFARIKLRFGYMEFNDVPKALATALEGAKSQANLDEATYFVGRETIVASGHGEMGLLPERLFALLERNTKSTVDKLGLPPDRVIEIGVRLDL
ncbi:MAG TPA: KUP/HAK/KT family potassium transporter [Polyangiaceae bacterium]|nr:KUP/HAK/KT family potassium transporter [Polyangiaceae bacterium]